jgi:hypothetical protein
VMFARLPRGGAYCEACVVQCFAKVVCIFCHDVVHVCGDVCPFATWRCILCGVCGAM